MKSIEEQIAEIINEINYYDAGILNDFGGGDTQWWQDYIRSELNRANDYYIEQFIDRIQRILSEVTIEVECPECKGEGIFCGFAVGDPCSACKGTGKITKTLKEAIEGMK